VDIVVDGTEYAVTTVTGTYNQYAAALANQASIESSWGSGAGLYTGTGFNATANGDYFGYRALAFANAYYNAVLADPNAGSDGTPSIADAENTYFIDYAFPGNNPVELSTQNQVQPFYAYQQSNNTVIFAELTQVAAPEASSFGWVGAAASLVFAVVGFGRKSNKPVSA
jgi:hypothetical protein